MLFTSVSDMSRLVRPTDSSSYSNISLLIDNFRPGWCFMGVPKWGHVNTLVTFSNDKYCTKNSCKSLTHSAILKTGLIMQHQGLWPLFVSVFMRRLHTITSVCDAQHFRHSWMFISSLVSSFWVCPPPTPLPLVSPSPSLCLQAQGLAHYFLVVKFFRLHSPLAKPSSDPQVLRNDNLLII